MSRRPGVTQVATTAGGGRMASMKASIVLTVIGPDRPGLVEALSQAVASHGGNWEEGRMAHLDGQFAGLLRVVVPESQRAALEAALGEVSGLSVTSTAGPSRAGTDGDPRYTLLVLGQDREGIVLELSRALSSRGVNVEELSSTCESAPMSGETMFRATAQLRVPTTVSLDGLREQLEAIGDDLMVDVSLSPVE